jgi:hypothetical protein
MIDVVDNDVFNDNDDDEDCCCGDGTTTQHFEVTSMWGLRRSSGVDSVVLPEEEAAFIEEIVEEGKPFLLSDCI